MTRPRVVFDCNALLQALVSETGPAAEALRRMEAGAFDLQLSRPVLNELRTVLRYPAIRRRNPELTDADVAAFLHRLLYRGTLLRRVPHRFDYPRARQDEAYIDLAIASKAAFLVTRDKDLLWLMTGHTAMCKQFRQRTHPLRVLDPVEFLQAVVEESP